MDSLETSPPAELLFHWPQWSATRGDQVALLFEQASGDSEPTAPLGQMTWRQLVCAVESLAQQLHAAGFSPGQRLAHASGNSCRGVLVALASLALGTIEVPIDPALSAAAGRDLADSVGGRSLELASESDRGSSGDPGAAAEHDWLTAAASLQARHAQRDAAEAALILFTSGTSGKTKAVTLSRRNLATNAAAKLCAVPQSPRDVRLCLLPICHAYARTCDLGTWLLSGCSLAITTGWDGWKRVAPLVRPTMVNTVPSAATRMLDEPSDSPEQSALRVVGCGGAALSEEAFARFAARRMTVIQGYGMTEASPVICSASPENARAGWVGPPVAGCITRVQPDGRLWVRGDGVMLGYWNDPQETARTIVDGWLDTGDLVQVDAQDGQLRIVGRADDRITLASARKIHPAPIEQRLLGLDGVLHALLVPAGRHVEVWLDVRAQTRQRDDWDRRVAAMLRDLPAWQRPRRVVVLPQPLAEIPGALTRKGTPVRSVVIASRK